VCNGSETHLSCWQDCKPWSLDGVCINRTDSHCDPDCAKQVDDDCWGVFNLSLIQGWNLVSSPIIPDENISILFGNSTLYSYSNGTWVQLNGNINLSAFWIYMTQNTSVEVAGAKVEKNNFDLHEGWNLVGHASLVDTNISTMFTTLNVTGIYSYNGSWLSYVPNRTINTLTTMKPGYGYWVNVGG